MNSCCGLTELIGFSNSLCGIRIQKLKTSEAADEVKMEVEDTTGTAHTLQCEQPVSIPSPVELGSAESASKEGAAIKEVAATTQMAASREVAVEVAASQGGAAKHAVAGQFIGSQTVNTGKETEKIGSEIEEISEKKVDRLERLAQQIEDFDPVAILNKSDVVSTTSSVSSEFTRDINDEKLIDELVESGNEGGDEAENNQYSNEREVTPCNDSEEDNSTINLADTETSVISKADHQQANGCESEDEELDSNGIEQEQDGNCEADDKNQQDATKTDDKQSSQTDEKVSKQGDKTQKQELSSPTKSGKSKRKEDKSIDHILKALSSLQTTEEKLAALCKKYADLHEDHRNLQTSFKQGQRKLTVITREKDQLQSEHTKAVMAKSKLESLCRELQKHNQTVRQESIQRAREEDEKRKEISQKFQTTIGEIQQQMQENHEKNKQLREENFELANKLKKFIEQYEAREKQIEKVIQHRELEQKLADAKLEQATAILMEEKAKNQKERELLLLQTTEYVKKLQMKETELSMYKERYEEFQSTIKKSEEMFQKFKTEMDKMTKRCKKLEKDGVQWKQKWENANRALLEMAEEMRKTAEKTKYDKERPMLMSKISKLESLCRAMQAERKARKILESDGIDMSKLTIEDDVPGDEQLKEQDPVAGDGSSASAMSASGFTPSLVESGPVKEDSTEEGESDDKSEAGSCQSSASINTGVTVIQQDTTNDAPPEASQLNGEQHVPGSQLEGSDSNAISDGQSASTAKETNQSEKISEPSAS